MKTFSVILDNRPGALDRITGLIRRSGWNIQDIVASQTNQEGVTMVTMSVLSKGMSDEPFKERFLALDCVKGMSIFSPDTHVMQEMVLVRLPSGCDCELSKISDENGYSVYKFSGSRQQVDDLIAALPPGSQYSRTGGLIMFK